ncbi:DUF6443 domain-containing protein [Mucilaginibacter sp. NFR10]|uniref:DUF6443 domain-containing protein n=1 Tax=Mucilaginibacter sp. NFR10 TaxID=1566292 RepID=UPI0008716028|nr:DUF6443 domain-containing protein [Mucilaginibacter sp. NFR10]SCW74419.1 RHS repeat-associated core domain-containing protein [Mucilaginibacter sp. NFR10]
MKYKIFHISLLLGILVCINSVLHAQSKQGFVQQEKVNIAGVTADTSLAKLNVFQKQTSRVYYDGLGRTIQSIVVKASPLQNDLIQPVAYDNLGRQTKSYLPYAGKATDTTGFYRPNAVSTDQPGFYNNLTQYLTANDGNPYSQQVFENSPLQRQLSSGMVGSGFQPVSGQHYKTAVYRYNSSAQDGSIPVWNYDGSFTASNYYPNNSLSVTDGKDEDNTETLVFTNKEGQTVLKRQKLGAANLDTYYIYNMAGMISYVVPPQAVSLMAGSYSLSTTAVKNLVFHYLYDSMGRLVEKKVPSAGTVAIVYDPVNRPVLVQDSNMRVANKWNYIKYDAKGRVVSQGIYTDVTRTGRTAMQSYVSGLASSYNTTWYESRTATLTNSGYYTSTIFPTSSTGTLTPLAYAYYDDYDVDNNGTANFSYAAQGLTNESSPTQSTLRGVPTVICQSTVGSAIASNIWLTKVTFYDKRGNPIQVQSNNQLSYTAMFTLTDKKTTVPDFTGAPQITKTSVQAPSGTTSVQTNFTYDHMYRVTAIDQYYNGSATVSHVATYSYNELGQVYQKKLAPVSASSYLQSVDLRYNIRGQLLSINNSKLSNDSGQTNGDTNDLFGMQLLYEKVDANLGNTGYYNGKLSAIKWMSRDGSNNSSYERAFKYYYDGLNRDTAAVYAERTTAGTGAFSITHGWDEDRITYDLNGNIKTLYRNATTQGTGGHSTIDNLTYTYDANSPNQLKTVSDASGNTTGFMGGSGTYTYDGNGNLTNEPYKGLSAISYNVLNRTDQISFSSSANRFIKYAYSASGILIRKQQYDNVGGVATLQTTTDYIDGFVFTTAGAGTAALQYFNMPEGRVLNNAGTLSQEFTIADQQGNVRIAFDNTGTGGTAKTRQENSYYAFGMIMPGSTVATPGNPNKNLYNGGSEWQNDYGNLPDYYQTFYRNYDAALGRWIGVDPKGESAESMTGYQYAGNNPAMMNDPMGDLFEATDGIAKQLSGHEIENMNLWLNSGGMQGGLLDNVPTVGGVSTAGGGKNGVSVYIDADGNVSYMEGSKNSYIVKQNENNEWIFNKVSSNVVQDFSGLAKNFLSNEFGYIPVNLGFEAYNFLGSRIEKGIAAGLRNDNPTNLLAPNDFQLEQQNLVFDRMSRAVSYFNRNGEVFEAGLEKTFATTAKTLGFASTLVGTALSVYNRNGVITLGDAVKGVIGYASTVGPIGWIYTGLDIGTAYLTGKSITDRIGSAVDEAFPEAKMKLY